MWAGIVLVQLFRYAIAGSVGFLVDGGILYLLVSSGAGPYESRAISFPLAVTVTWLINRYFTFAGARRGGTRQYAAYFGLQVGAAAVNFATYSAVLWAIGVSPAKSVLALAVGSVIGLAINFFGCKFFVFEGEAQPSSLRRP
jgi:putative flippase GtrA